MTTAPVATPLTIDGAVEERHVMGRIGETGARLLVELDAEARRRRGEQMPVLEDERLLHQFLAPGHVDADGLEHGKVRDGDGRVQRHGVHHRPHRVVRRDGDEMQMGQMRDALRLGEAACMRHVRLQDVDRLLG